MSVYGTGKTWLSRRPLAQEKPGQTLQATALVHEAYVRLVGVDQAQQWNSRGHFFAAAAEAMRRILVEQARKKQAAKRGGARQRSSLTEAVAPEQLPPWELLALNEALEQLARDRPEHAALVQLRFFAGLTLEDAAASLGISPATAKRDWSFARAWLLDAMGAR